MYLKWICGPGRERPVVLVAEWQCPHWTNPSDEPSLISNPLFFPLTGMGFSALQHSSKLQPITRAMQSNALVRLFTYLVILSLWPLLLLMLKLFSMKREDLPAAPLLLWLSSLNTCLHSPHPNPPLPRFQLYSFLCLICPTPFLFPPLLFFSLSSPLLLLIYSPPILSSAEDILLIKYPPR